jgi:beta-lactamase regulating signal transducer with metallopeptidase domain/peroxiredoxin
MNAASWLPELYGDVSFSILMLLVKLTALFAVGWLLHGLLMRANPLWRVVVWRSAAAGAVALVALALLPALVAWEVLPPAVEGIEQPAHEENRNTSVTGLTAPAGVPPAPESLIKSADSPHALANRNAPGPAIVGNVAPDIDSTAHSASFAAPPPAATSPVTTPEHSTSLGRSAIAAPLAAIWLVGVLLLASRSAIGILRIRRIRQRAQAIPIWAAAEAAVVADSLDCRIPLSLRQTAEVSTPCLVGLIRPDILLPSKHCTAGNRDELQAILAHEIAHLRGRDLLWNALLHILSLLLWFHPLVWRSRAAHAHSCDAVADQVAADFVGDATWYGRVLARLALEVSRCVATPALAMARTSNVRHRIEWLRRHAFPARLPRRRVATALALTAVAVVFFGGLRLAPSQTNAQRDATAKKSSSDEKPASKPGKRRLAGGIDDVVAAEQPGDAKARLTIRAVADANGEPLENVAIDVHGRIGGKVIRQNLTTNEEGVATLEWEHGAIVQNLWMTADKPRLAPLHYTWRSELRAIELPEQLEMRFQPGVVVGGIVRDKLGQPIAGAKVAMRMPVTSPRLANYVFTAAELTTDKDGRWQWSSAPVDLASVGMSVEHSDYRPAGGRIVKDGESIVVLDQGISIKGRALDRDGKPIKFALARLGFDHFGSSEPKTRADEDGNFVLKNCNPGKSLVTVQADGFAPQFQDLVVAEGAKPLEFKLEPGATMRVRVVDEQGQPVVGAIFASDTWRGYRTLEFRRNTDADGRIVWDSAPSDTVLCDILKTGHLAIRRTPLKASDEEHVITLRREFVISGTVADAITGKPLPSFRVRHGRLLEGGREVYWSLDEPAHFTDGKYSMKFDEPSEAYVLQFDADGFLPTESPRFNPQDGPKSFDVQLKPGEGSSAVVLLAGGEPAEGAEVVLATRERRVSFRQGRVERNAAAEITKIGADGRFRLPAQNNDQPFVVAIVHDEGFAELTGEEMARSKQISLQPWGRIAGMVRRGNRPDANRLVTYYPQSAGRGIPIVRHDYQTTTDSLGRFSFERVIPGRGELARVTVTEFHNSRLHTPGWHTPVEVKQGDITRVTLGGTGRVIVGQLKLDREADFPIVWTTNEPVRISRNSSAVGEVNDAFRCAANFDQSGQFSIPDVPPGNYRLQLRINNPPVPNSVGAGSAIGEAKLDFEVPKTANGETDQPIDLGTITASLFDTLDAGEQAPDFVAEAIAGDSIRLSDYRGKVVLLSFWATSLAPWLAEMPTLKEIQQKHGANERFAILGLSSDRDLATAKKYIDNADLGWRQGYIGPGGGVVAERYMVRAFPATFLIGPDQRVLAKNLSGDKLKEAVKAALADEGLFKKQANVDRTRFPVTRFTTAADAPATKPAAIVLDNTDPTFEANKPHHDRLIALDAAGKELWSLDGLNNAQSVGGVHGVVFDRRRERVYIREDIANRITALNLSGKKLRQIDGIEAGAIAVDEQTGHVWTTGGGSRLDQGETIVFDQNGNQVAAHPYVGIDIAYSPHDGAFWLAGYEIIKLSRDGKVLFRKRAEGWCCASVSANTTDGSVWITERDHPDVPRSRNRVWLLSAAGETRATVELGKTDPFAIACDSNTGEAWVACLGGGLRRVSKNGQLSEPVPIEASQVAISPRSGDIWVTTKDEVLRLNGDGKVLTRVPFGKPSSQSWLAAF